jgi:DNA-directed RNA polymerase specialized sigma24 family protein
MNGNGHRPGEVGTRDEANAASMETTGTSFEAAWALVRPRVERLLRSKGVKPDVIDDVTQETGIKLLTNWARVDPERPLWPLARTIALNCLVDQFRARTAEPVADLPDRPDAYDLEEHGLARARLSVVSDAMASLRPGDRSVLLAEVTADQPTGSSSAVKMARMRARQRLNRALERSAAAFGGVPLALRKVATWVQLTPSGAESYATSVAGAAIAAVVVLGAVAPAEAERLQARPNRKIDVSAAGDQRQPRRADRAHATKKEQRRTARPVTDTTRDRAAELEAEAPAEQGSDDHDEPRETEVAEAGGKSAKAGSGKGYRYVVVCSDEEPDEPLGVTFYDGNQDGDEEQQHCE